MDVKCHSNSIERAIDKKINTNLVLRQFGFTGNTSSEDLICLLEEMGVSTGIDTNAMLENGKRGEEIIGQQLRANVIRSGPVNHCAMEYAPTA